MTQTFLVGLVLVAIVVSNHQVNNQTADNSTLSYKTDILPIIKSRCAICHNYSTPELDWTDYKTTYNKKEVIKLRLTNKTMPPNGFPLSEKERETIINWVNQGAKE